QVLLLNFSLQAQSSDRWQWQRNPAKGYSIRDAYQLLTSQGAVTLDAAVYLIWLNMFL
ncbi:hypothetical protein A2U01_0100364, partial [Trifolium medium]|nr:hypothetical protein [Trifolium medium]